MIKSRFFIAIGLALLLGTLAYFEAVVPAFVLTLSALTYDYGATRRQLRGRSDHLFDLLFFFAFVSNLNLFLAYKRDPSRVLLMIAVVQISDIYQYLIGSTIGRHRIGPLSPKKTWEGYFGSLPFLLITFYFTRLTIAEIVTYWIAGIIGGLIYSAVKRKLGIKDFSNLLGDHGGYLDRTDSIYITGWVVRLFFI